MFCIFIFQRRLEDDDKENYAEGQRREKGKPQSGINFSRSKDDGKSRKRKKHNKERGKRFVFNANKLTVSLFWFHNIGFVLLLGILEKAWNSKPIFMCT